MNGFNINVTRKSKDYDIHKLATLLYHNPLNFTRVIFYTLFQKRMMIMKLPNGYGSITKLSGNRRKPYMVRISAGYDWNEETLTNRPIRHILGYYRTRKEALEALSQYNANPYDLNKKDVTFGELYTQWSTIKYTRLAESSISCYKAAYNYCKSIENTPISSLKLGNLQNIINNCPHGSNTKKVIKGIMTNVFDFAMQNDIINKNYAAFIEIEASDPVYERSIFTENEVNLLWTLSDKYEARILLILLYSGMRVNELLKMPRECCHLDEYYLDIQQAKNKSSVRKVPIHNKIYKFIEDFYNKNTKMLVTNDLNSNILYNNFVNREFKRLMDELNTSHKLHDTRHTFITLGHQYKLNELCLKKIVGHSPDNITQKVYTHIEVPEMLKEINKIK